MNSTKIIIVAAILLSIYLYVFTPHTKPIDVEEFTSLSPAPLKSNIGPYDGLQAIKKENEMVLMKDALYVPQGHAFPLTPSGTNLSSEESNGPNVDGTSETPRQMYMWAHNKCEPGCCPSTYSCDGGCICATKKQNDFIASRGQNKISHYDDEY